MYGQWRKLPLSTIREVVTTAFVAISFIVLSAVNSPSVKADALPASTLPQQITLVYEPVHNPPRALGRGTAINWDRPGLTLELLRLVEGRLGVKFTFRRMPWKRGLYLLKKNEVDGVFHASFKPEREHIGVYPKKDGQPDQSRAIFFQSYVLYKANHEPLPRNEDGVLKGLVGTISDYAIASELRRKGYDVEEASTQKLNFDKLMRGQIIAFATLENMADDYLIRNSDRYTSIVKVQPSLNTKAYYLLLSHAFVKAYPDLSERIWDTIAEMKDSEAFKEIIAQY